jgi:hypothetical protein
VLAGVIEPVKQTQITWPSVRELTAQAPESRTALRLATAPIHHYRDGDVVVYRRPGSAVWQCRCKLAGGRWLRLSTRQRNLQDVAHRACEPYDEMGFRVNRLGAAQIYFAVDIAPWPRPRIRWWPSSNSGETASPKQTPEHSTLLT